MPLAVQSILRDIERLWLLSIHISMLPNTSPLVALFLRGTLIHFQDQHALYSIDGDAKHAPQVLGKCLRAQGSHIEAWTSMAGDLIELRKLAVSVALG